jgi:hypothetical protein
MAFFGADMAASAIRSWQGASVRANYGVPTDR